MKYLTIIILAMGLFSFFPKKKNIVKTPKQEESQALKETEEQIVNPIPYDKQINVFKSLGYEFEPDVTKEMILYSVYEMTWDDATEEHIEKNPFSILYYIYGWRDPNIKSYNYTNKCIWFDLDFFDPNSQYKWFMERMGAISNGEIKFTNIQLETDAENWEWISFDVNGITKKWKLEKSGYVADHFVQRFSYLANELNTKGKYTYYDNGGQQWVIDFATDDEQKEFNQKTGMKREWLGEGNHFSEPPKD